MKTGDIALALVVIFGGYLLWRNGTFSFVKGAQGSAGNPTVDQTVSSLRNLVSGNWGPVADPAVYAQMLAAERSYTEPDNGPQGS